ncbi:MAG: hypothetical protein LBJ02_09100 [Bifidobacteriaceae bacterium]|nr:hypothetical protein [Bifidobacteriaceae bacterium]
MDNVEVPGRPVGIVALKPADAGEVLTLQHPGRRGEPAELGHAVARGRA